MMIMMRTLHQKLLMFLFAKYVLREKLNFRVFHAVTHSVKQIWWLSMKLTKNARYVAYSSARYWCVDSPELFQSCPSRSFIVKGSLLGHVLLGHVLLGHVLLGHRMLVGFQKNSLSNAPIALVITTIHWGVRMVEEAGEVNILTFSPLRSFSSYLRRTM